ncbi:MAG: serine/threonine-protein kinase, partial [Acidobacteriota bacterium]
MKGKGQHRDAELQLLQVLERAVDLDPEARDALFAEYPDEVAEKARLLLSEGVTEAFLDSPAAIGDLAVETGPFPTTTRVGPYEVLGLLGEGGMGRVYLAEQHEPVRRRVALKLLRLSLLNRGEAARFEAERQAMGRLDHVNVGKILEAGTTESGLPFIAMEWIDGPPITTYCDDNALSIEERLRLFIDVCRGVDHAHRKLLLHRDIKPSNILVAEFDGRPIPKLIDFGIAKGLDLDESTRGYRLAGTPTYMSPESLSDSGSADIRSDVFALGVVLYELLAGVQPWTRREPRQVGLRSDELPERPSTRVSGLDVDRQGRIAEMRRETRASLAKGLRGDLDWIVMKAIATKPSERYASAAEVAQDLERYLRAEPVTARKATARYLIQQLIRRNRRVVGIAALVAALLVLGIVGTTFGLIRARQAEQTAKLEAAEAVQARDEAESVVAFLAQIFGASGVENMSVSKPPTELTALELLERSSERIDRDLDVQPRTEARLRQTLGQIYRQLGVFDTADQHLKTASDLLADTGAPADERVDLLIERAELSFHQSQLDAVRGYLDQVAELMPELSDEVRTALEPRWLSAEGTWASRVGRFDEAIEWMEKALPSFDARADPLGLASALNNLGNIYFNQRRWSDAEVYFRRSLEQLEAVLGAEHARVAVAADNLGASIASQDRFAEAIPFFEQALTIRRRMLAPGHPRIADSLNNIGRLHYDSERFADAETTHREALAIRRAALEPTHPKIAWSLDNLSASIGAQ